MSNLSLSQLFGQYNQTEIRWNNNPAYPIWAAVDIGKALDLKSNGYELTRNLDDDEKGTITIRTLGGKQQLAGVTESGLYRLIFQSRKSGAKEFQRWVFHDVLPEIRKKGTYNLGEKQPEAFENVYTKRLFFSADHIKIPANHWIIFDECGKVMRFLERNVEINKFDLVDGSVGKCWSNYRKQQAEKGADWLRDRAIYNHPFPDKRGIKECWAYHFNELPHFRVWFQGEYIPFHLWNYLKGKYPIDTVRQLEASHHQLVLT